MGKDSIHSQTIKNSTPLFFFFFLTSWWWAAGRGGGKWPYLRKVSKVLAGSDFKLHIKLIQDYALIKARAGNSYGFSSSLQGQHRKAINVLLLTQAASFQKISHQWPFTLCLAPLLSNCTWSESNADQCTEKFLCSPAASLNNWVLV